MSRLFAGGERLNTKGWNFMKKLTTYLLSTGCIIAAALGMSAVASADVTVKSSEAEIVLKKGEDAVATASFDSLDKALDAVAKAQGDLTITLDKDYSTSKKFPTKAGSITIGLADGVETATIEAKAGFALKSDLTLNNVSIKGGGAKTKASTSANISLKGTSTLSNFGSLKGGKGEASTLTFEADQVFDFDISGFGKIDVPANKTLNLVGAKKNATTELAIAENGIVNMYNVPLTVDALSGKGTIYYYSITDTAGKTTDPSFITIKKEVETAPAIKLGYKTATGTAADHTGDAEEAFPAGTKVLTVSKPGDNGAAAGFSLTKADNSVAAVDAVGTVGEEGYVPAVEAQEATVDYVFSIAKKKDVYVRPAVFGFYTGKVTESSTPVKYSTWTEITDAIATANAETAAYTVKLLGAADVEGAMKMPKKGTYASLTIEGDSKSEVVSTTLAGAYPKAAAFFSKTADDTTTYYVAATKSNKEVIPYTYYEISFEGSKKNYAFKEVDESSSSDVSGAKDLTTDNKSSFADDADDKRAENALKELATDGELEDFDKVVFVTTGEGDDESVTFYAAKAGTAQTLTVYGGVVALTAGTADEAGAKDYVDDITDTTGYTTVEKPEDVAIYIRKDLGTQLGFTGGISATSDLTLKNVELFAYKAVKNKDKSITKQGVATSLSAGKYNVTLDNVTLYEGDTVNKISATTLKGVAAGKLTLSNIELKADKISGTQLNIPEDAGEVSLVTPSIAFKGNTKADNDADKPGIVGEAGSVSLTITDKKTGAVLTDPKKAKATIADYAGQFQTLEAGDKDYTWAYSGKVLVPIESSKAMTVEYSYGTGDNTVYGTVYVADLASASTYIANGVKAGTLDTSAKYEIGLTDKPAKLTFPKKDTYASIRFWSDKYDSETGNRVTVNLGTVKSLALTGNLILSEDVTLKVTTLKDNGYTLTYEGATVASIEYVKQIATNLKPLVENAGGVDALLDAVAADTDGTGVKSSYDSAIAAITAVEENSLFNAEDSTDYAAQLSGAAFTKVADAKKYYDNFKAAKTFYEAQKAQLAKMPAVDIEEEDPTDDHKSEAAKAAFDAYTALSTEVKALLKNQVKSNTADGVTYYTWEARA